MACFHCECKRPPDEFLENKMQDRTPSFKPKLNKMGSRQEVSNAWNFDFDDNESDGADVAAFEYADTHVIDEDLPSDNQAKRGKHRGWEDNFEKKNRVQESPDGEYANPDLYRPRIGFDDFEDEDDIDSYELETTQNSSRRMEASKNNFSEAENFSESEDTEAIDDRMHARHKTGSGRSVQSRSIRKNTSFAGSDDDELDFGTDEQRSILSNFKSGHVSAAEQKRKGKGPSKKLSFGSESEEDIGAGLYSDEDDDLDGEYSFRKDKGNKGDPSRQNKGNRHDSGRRNFTRDRKSGSIGGRQANMFSSDDDFDVSSQQSYRNGRGSRGNDRNRKSFEHFDGPSRRSYGDGRESRGSNRIGSSRQLYGNGRGSQGNDRNWQKFEDCDRPSRKSYGDDRGSRGNRIGSSRQSYGNGRGSRGNSRNRQRFGDKERGTGQFNKRSMDEKDFGEFRNSRRVIER